MEKSDLRRRAGIATIIRVFEDGTREMRMENGRRVRMRFQRCPGCKVERPESSFTMALCFQCRKIELVVEPRHICDRGNGEPPKAYLNKRYSRKVAATPPWVDRNELGRVYAEARRITKETGIPHQVDHIWPLEHESFCGLHVPWNLRVIPASRNAVKGNKPPLDYFQQIGVQTVSSQEV